jgi:hypothetical protein
MHRHLGWLVWLLMAYIACFAISQGAVVWVYISEVFPTNVRAKGQSIGSSSHWIMNAIISLVFPLMAMSLSAYPFIFFAAMTALDFFIVLSITRRLAASRWSRCSIGLASSNRSLVLKEIL